MKIKIDWVRTMPANHRKVVCVKIELSWFGRLIGLKDHEIFFIGWGTQFVRTKKIFK